MTNAPESPTADRPDFLARAWVAIDKQSALGRAVRERAIALLGNAQRTTTPDGWVCVRKDDYEALLLALEQESEHAGQIRGDT